MSLLDTVQALPWYGQLFVLGGLTGGWWYFVDSVFDKVKRRPTGKEGPT